MYILSPDGTTATPYSVDALKRDNPQVSFPETIFNELLALFNVFPVVSSKPEINQETQLVYQDGYLYNTDSGHWEIVWVVCDKTPEKIQAEIALRCQEIRRERNNLLAQCDWTQLSDCPVNNALWATYRQELRDITKQVGFPSEVVWPSQPS